MGVKIILRYLKGIIDYSLWYKCWLGGQHLLQGSKNGLTASHGSS